MSQKRRKADSGKAIGETTALRWEPIHITKPNPRVVPLQTGISRPISLRRFDVQMSWQLQSESVIYSASVEERATDFCL